MTEEMASLGTLEMDHMIAEGNHVVVQSRATGRFTKSGRPNDKTFCRVYEILDGKIPELTEYCDTSSLRVCSAGRSDSFN
jgi:ketosteroid isomerase-like protein